MSTAEVIQHHPYELTRLREQLDGTRSFLEALSDFCGAPVHIDPPRRSNDACLGEVERVWLREAADIPSDAAADVVRGYLRALHQRRTLARVHGTAVAALDTVLIPRRIPAEARDQLFRTAEPLGEILEPHGRIRRTRQVAVRWHCGTGHELPSSHDTEILRVSAQLDLDLPVAAITETVYAAALHQRHT